MDIFAETLRVELAKGMGKIKALEVASAARPPNPVTVTEGVLDPTTWAGLIVSRGSAAAEYWKKKTLTPKKDPIKAGIDAEAYYASQTKKSIESGARKKALEKTNLTEWGEDVEATPASKYGDALTNKSAKIARKIGKLQPLVEGLRKAIAAMPETTDPEREKKMIAARRGMKLVGQVMKGVVGPESITKAISELK
jgi:hypothetical protein